MCSAAKESIQRYAAHKGEAETREMRQHPEIIDTSRPTPLQRREVPRTQDGKNHNHRERKLFFVRMDPLWYVMPLLLAIFLPEAGAITTAVTTVTTLSALRCKTFARLHQYVNLVLFQAVPASIFVC
jgi:hypothetical protein